MAGYDENGSYQFASLEKKYSSFISPTFKIQVGGFKLDSTKIPVSHLEIQLTTENKAGTCSFTVEAMYDYETGVWSDGFLDKIDVGLIVKVEIGYASSQKRVFYGYVDRYRIDYSSEGAPRLQVSAMDGMGLLMSNKEKLDFGKRSTTDVVKELVSECQKEKLIESSKVDQLPTFEGQFVKEKACSNYDFLCRLAEMCFVNFCIIDGELVFKNLMKNSSPLLELQLGRNLMEFSKDIGFSQQTVGSVTVISTGTPNKEEVRGEATLTGGYSAYKGFKNLANSELGMGTLDASVESAAGLSAMGGGLSALAKAAQWGAGAGKVAGKAAAGFGIISGAANIYSGGRTIHQGRMQVNAMEDYLKDAGDRKDLEGDDLLLRDIATQGKMEGTRKKIEGTGQVLTGGMDAAAAALDLGGVSAGIGAGVTAASAATKAGFAIANEVQKDRMTNKVMEQTTGLTEEMIRNFQKANHIKSYSRAKQALMKALGYTSGTRAELFADQTEQRGNKLASMANSGNQKAETLAKGLGAERKGIQNEYSGDEIAKNLGLRESREEIANKHSSIKAMAAANRKKPAQTTVQEKKPGFWSRTFGRKKK